MEVKKPGFQTALSEITEVVENTILNSQVILTPYFKLGFSLGYIIPATFPMHSTPSTGTINRDLEKIGMAIPPFSFNQTNGTVFTEENVKNKKFVLVFFSPWSALSIEGISQISGSYQKLPSQAQVVGVSVQESPSATDTFLVRGKYDFFAVSDYSGKYSSDMGITTLPYYVFVDANGGVQETFTGVLTQVELLKKLENM